MEREILGTVVSTMDGPSPSRVDFVVNNGIAHKGMFIELNYSEGTMVCMIEELIKTNRYFERPDSVKAIGDELEKNFPAAEWEFLIAKAKPLGVFSDSLIQRSTFPPSPGTKVFVAQNENIKKFLKLDDDGLNLGKVQFHDVFMKTNLSKLLQKHLAVLAMSGAGKCVKYSEQIQLANGSTIEIGKLVDEQLKKENVCVDGVETAIAKHDVKVMSLSKDTKLVPSKIKAFMRRKSPKSLVAIETCAGKKIEVTPEHLIPVIREKIEWVPACQLENNDFILSPRLNIDGSKQKIDFAIFFDKSLVKTNLIKDNNCSKPMPRQVVVDKEFARFLAYLLAEGHNFGGGFSFSNNSTDIQNDFEKLLKKIMCATPKKVKDKGEVRYYNKTFCFALAKIGFTNSSWTKFVSKEILMSDEKVIAAFLSAFIDCDGYVSEKGEIEITLASKQLIDSIEIMFLRLGVVAFRKIKRIDNKEYSRLFVRGVKNMQILNNKLNLIIDYKRKTLTQISLRKSNPNVDIIPNINGTLLKVFTNLRLTQGQFLDKRIVNYCYNRNYPSHDGLDCALNIFRKRLTELELSIFEVKQLFYSLPNLSEDYAKEIISLAYQNNNFNQIVLGTNISSTTARRIVRGITKPTKSSFLLAQNCLKLENNSDVGVEIINNLDLNQIARKTLNLCKQLNVKSEGVCIQQELHKNALYSWTNGTKKPVYSNLYCVVKGLFKKSLRIEKTFSDSTKKINFLQSLIDSDIFFDKVKKVEKVKSTEKYVYDLSVTNHSFVANNLIIHNSYFMSVLVEELSKRKRDQGQIATIIFDTHGEYTCFGEVASKEYTDFSTNTRVINASKIKIATSSLNKAMLASIIPSITPVQKRELFRIISKLNAEMRTGTGPFDLNSIKEELASVDSKTAIPLLFAIDELESLKLFSKIDEPGPLDLAKPGQLSIIDLNNVISEKKKQIIVSYFSRKLFNARRIKKVCPFALIVEEAHNFIPETTAAEHALAKPILRTIAREGRKFGASLIVVSQRPKRLDTTTLANCNTNIILRITNPYDLDHIKQSSEGLDSNSVSMISSLRVGEAVIVGEAVSAPTFFKVRLRESMPSKHEFSLEDSAKMFYSNEKKQADEIDTFL